MIVGWRGSPVRWSRVGRQSYVGAWCSIGQWDLQSDLLTGESYELYSGSESRPSILVHVREDPVGYDRRPSKILQTSCPDRHP